MVEKPKPGTAQSNLYINGRYILQPEIFAILEKQERGAGNEIQLTDGMLKLEKDQGFYGYHYRGRTFDCGSPEGFVEANVAFALARPDLSAKMADASASARGKAASAEKPESVFGKLRVRASERRTAAKLTAKRFASALQLQPQEDAVGLGVAVRQIARSRFRAVRASTTPA